MHIENVKRIGEERRKDIEDMRLGTGDYSNLPSEGGDARISKSGQEVTTLDEHGTVRMDNGAIVASKRDVDTQS